MFLRYIVCVNLLIFFHMAKNVGLIKFSGALGNLVGYYRNGKYVLQGKGGFSGDRIKVEERYAVVRANNTDFGRCSKISSMFKSVFDGYLEYLPVYMMFNWIQSQVMGIKNCDLESEKGAKTFLNGLKTEAGSGLFRRFAFAKDTSLFDVVEVEGNGVLEDGVLKFRFLPVKGFKGCVAGVSLVVLSVDFDAPSCAVYSSGLTVVAALDGLHTLSVALPKEDAFLVAFLSVMKGLPSGDGYVWLRDKENVLGVVDFKLP